MIDSFSGNRALLESTRKDRKGFRFSGKRKALKFKQSTAEELEQFRLEIKAKSVSQRKRKLITFAVLAVVLFIGLKMLTYILVN